MQNVPDVIPCVYERSHGWFDQCKSYVDNLEICRWINDPFLSVRELKCNFDRLIEWYV